MVQSLNTKALLTLASVARRPSLLVPHVAVSNISELNYTALKERCGIKAVIFDKDNTLTAPYGMSLHEDARSGLSHAQSVFGSSNVAIMSNSAGTLDDPEYKDAAEIEDKLGIAVIRHTEKKPGGLEEVMDHFEVDDAAELCMVGDRLLTDIVFGNLHGMLTVHTLPLCKGKDNQNDNTVANIIRKVENTGLYSNWFVGRKLLASRMEHKYWKGEDYCSLKISLADPTNLRQSDSASDNGDKDDTGSRNDSDDGNNQTERR
uniref:Phosphatidylglycerophosphatase n=2 Tax=Craspedostauros australis TaxID=1486917 RepID=A0A7R9X168_9STRA|mmetsp:Transcript_5253/g.14179  ORF Transcript_5253/g.14179 Transcript_5253/m.14179 type:complete len:261 (+) Transcript_5253:280-1062(+)|eukprot:CAMPEP_0198114326 /NCGR_PEP_ID=MMETSP1442-20131203/5740_1 /TAXON_ID= /ORGANISM="Craspedostauros australis, Strain CCMP3328" /LENGTH=260 /DNA_ID=CAMNT_0043771615 /DNA_START=253 /DNA_END=1035 /DNA_ORIENTATION=-